MEFHTTDRGDAADAGAALGWTAGGGGPVLPGAGWAFVTVIHNADSKPSWKCNFCDKITSGSNHTRVSFHFAMYINGCCLMWPSGASRWEKRQCGYLLKGSARYQGEDGGNS